jgi:hypothetical protein
MFVSCYYAVSSSTWDGRILAYNLSNVASPITIWASPGGVDRTYYSNLAYDGSQYIYFVDYNYGDLYRFSAAAPAPITAKLGSIVQPLSYVTNGAWTIRIMSNGFLYVLYWFDSAGNEQPQGCLRRFSLTPPYNEDNFVPAYAKAACA